MILHFRQSQRYKKILFSILAEIFRTVTNIQAVMT